MIDFYVMGVEHAHNAHFAHVTIPNCDVKQAKYSSWISCFIPFL